MTRRTNRRNFLKTTALTGVGFWVAGGVAPRPSRAANETINFASIGVGGKGQSDSADAGRHGNMVAICDVDENNLSRAAARWPQAKKYYDYRKMLDEMGKSIDAVTISTPDHTHAVATAMAMKMGKHVFTQKPLTHTIYEARMLGQIARETGVATQMGNQGTAESGLREGAAIIQSGALGPIKEVHVWTNRPVWPQGISKPEGQPVPSHLHWEEWLGPAAFREYNAAYHPFKWRGWWDFGTGALGDMACHTMNLPFMALDLRNPTSVQAETSGHNQETFPSWSVITYEFAANDKRPALKLFWYDGGKKPPQELLQGAAMNDSGSITIGEKGSLYSPHDYGAKFEVLGDVEVPQVEYERSPGHFEEWVNAIKGGPAARSNFPEYASPLTETVLLGNLAVWLSGQKVEWDAEKLEAKNAPEAQGLVKREYREGYSL